MKKLIEKLERKGLGPGGKCECPECGHVMEHGLNKPCMEEICPKCGAAMDRKG